LGGGVSCRRAARKVIEGRLYSCWPLWRYIPRPTIACRTDASVRRKKNDLAIQRCYASLAGNILACAKPHCQRDGVESVRIFLRSLIPNSKPLPSFFVGRVEQPLTVWNRVFPSGPNCFPTL